jgi:hypothetical protein
MGDMLSIDQELAARRAWKPTLKDLALICDGFNACLPFETIAAQVGCSVSFLRDWFAHIQGSANCSHEEAFNEMQSLKDAIKRRADIIEP